jgi:ATP-dependent 26S proteasome regulatory subunit
MINVPNLTQRRDILTKITPSLHMASDINFEQLAFLTNGFVGADLVSLCREAALIVLLDGDRNSEKVCSNLINVNSFSRKGIPNVWGVWGGGVVSLL